MINTVNGKGPGPSAELTVKITVSLSADDVEFLKNTGTRSFIEPATVIRRAIRWYRQELEAKTIG